MQQQQQVSSRSSLRQRRINRGSLNSGSLTTVITVGIVIILIGSTFVADWLRTPEIELLATSDLISPNGDLDHDSTTISYYLSEDADVSARVISARGTVVRTLLLEEPQGAGQHSVTWSGLNERGEPVADGGYRLEINAQGTVRGSSQSANLTVDTTPPALQLANVPDGLRVRESSLTIQGVTDPDATVTVSGNPQPVLVDGQGQFSFPFRLGEGVNTIQVSAADPAGNTTSLRRDISLVLTPPEVAIASPVNDSWSNQALVTVSGRASPNVTLAINDQPVNLAQDGSFNHQLSLLDGDHLLRVVATDDVGNVTLEEVLVHVKTAAPAVFLNVEEGQVLNDPVLQLSGQTEAGATARVNGQAVPVGATGNFQLGLQLFEGENIVDVEVRDRAGNLTTVNRQVGYQVSTTPNNLDRLARGFSNLPALTAPAAAAAGILILLVFLRQRGLALTLSVDQQVFAPGLPNEGKVMLIFLEVNRNTRVTLEVLDRNGFPRTTILQDRRRTARKHTFTWDGYDDYGRPLPPGEYTIQAEAGTNPVRVTTGVQVHIQEDILVHRRGVVGQTVGLRRRRTGN